MQKAAEYPAVDTLGLATLLLRHMCKATQLLSKSATVQASDSSELKKLQCFAIYQLQVYRQTQDTASSTLDWFETQRQSTAMRLCIATIISSTRLA